jgi:hypothetical protein
MSRSSDAFRKIRESERGNNLIRFAMDDYSSIDPSTIGQVYFSAPKKIIPDRKGFEFAYFPFPECCAAKKILSYVLEINDPKSA